MLDFIFFPSILNCYFSPYFFELPKTIAAYSKCVFSCVRNAANRSSSARDGWTQNEYYFSFFLSVFFADSGHKGKPIALKKPFVMGINQYEDNTKRNSVVGKAVYFA